MYAASAVLYMEQGGKSLRISGLGVDASVGGVYGAPVTQVQLSFSYELVDGCYAVRVENWDRTGAYSVDRRDLGAGAIQRPLHGLRHL